MEGTYPVMMDGKVAGSLVVTREGAVRVFSLRCRYVEGIVRMSVYGEEGEGYLGIPMPEEGELRLVKRLSPAALRDFPAESWRSAAFCWSLPHPSPFQGIFWKRPQNLQVTAAAS